MQETAGQFEPGVDVGAVSAMGFGKGRPQTVLVAGRHDEVNKLPLNLKCAIATMWVYTGLVILLPLFIHHWEGKAL